MGIYDREYYRDEGSGFFHTLARPGQVWKWLIVANVAAFVVQLATRTSPGGHMDGWFTDLFALDTDKVLHGQVWRLITGGFLHSFAWSHILFNMLFLWWAGSEVEEIYGPREFLAFYFVGLAASSVAYVIWALAVGRHSVAIGASGAVTAVLVLFAMHFPTRTIYLFFFLPVPVILLVIFNVLQDTLGLLGGGARGGVAFAGHLGGAAFGFLYYKAQWRVSTWWPSFAGLRLRRPRPKLKVFRGESERAERVAAPARAAEADEHIEAELDAVLEKVARLGKASLTEREQNVLNKASEYYRQRRK